MKPLRNILDRLHPHFAEGGKLERFFPLYEAIDSFLYTPGQVTSNAAHVRDGMDLKRMMFIVVVALIPCNLMALWNTGYQGHLAIERSLQAGVPAEQVAAEIGWRADVLLGLGLAFDSSNFWANVVYGALWFLPVYIVTFAVGGLWEVLFATVRRHEVNEGFLVTGALFPLIMPPTIPLWQVAIGISFGVVIGKEIFGGTGRNILNPALVGRAFLFFAYPAYMSGDQVAGHYVWIAAPAMQQVDGLSGATTLTVIATAEQGMQSITATPENGGLGVSWADQFWGLVPGSMGETSTFCCLLGAAVLIWTGVGSWRIMTSMLVSTVVFALLMNLVESPTNPVFQFPWHWHLVSGGFAFALVFMATDPVSASMTDAGKWMYGVLIGFMTVLIRVVNPAYPEGVMLAILFANVFAPLIDYLVVQVNIKRRLARNAV